MSFAHIGFLLWVLLMSINVPQVLCVLRLIRSQEDAVLGPSCYSPEPLLALLLHDIQHNSKLGPGH